MQQFNVSSESLGPIDMDFITAICIIAQIQLATRHPKNTGGSRGIAEKFARTLRDMVIAIAPENALILEMGWDSNFDIY